MSRKPRGVEAKTVDGLAKELAAAYAAVKGAQLRLTIAGHAYETCICGPCKWRRDHAEAIARSEPSV